MLPNEPLSLCVAIDDVALATWAECLHLLRAIRDVADIALTWLVVPQYHGSAVKSHACERVLGALLARGPAPAPAPAQHRYTHCDEAPQRGLFARRFLRMVYPQREGEFADIDVANARSRIELGLRWFGQQGWPVNGFVPPPGCWANRRGARWRSFRSLTPQRIRIFTCCSQRIDCLRKRWTILRTVVRKTVRAGHCHRMLLPW